MWGSAQIEDVKACVRWTRVNADRLRIDPFKIVVLGHSSGARLALIAAGSANDPSLEGAGGNPGVGSEVAACVLFYVPAGDAIRSEVALHPPLNADSPDSLFESFNPITYLLRGAMPPTMLFHGTLDRNVTELTSRLVYQALVENGSKAELHLIEGAAHGFDSDPRLADVSAAWIDLFLDRHVVAPREYASD